MTCCNLLYRQNGSWCSKRFHNHHSSLLTLTGGLIFLNFHEEWIWLTCVIGNNLGICSDGLRKTSWYKPNLVCQPNHLTKARLPVFPCLLQWQILDPCLIIPGCKIAPRKENVLVPFPTAQPNNTEQYHLAQHLRMSTRRGQRAPTSSQRSWRF